MLRRAAALLALPFASLFAQSSIDRLAWMSGCWEQRAPNRVVLEMWMPPSAGLMMGASRTVMNSAVREFEQLRIVARGDTLVYIAMPSGQATAEFKTLGASDTSVKFENPAHDFPKLIEYNRISADSITARVAGPGPNGATRVLAYPMRRVSCSS